MSNWRRIRTRWLVSVFEDPEDPDVELARKWKLSIDYGLLYGVLQNNPLGRSLLKKVHAEGRIQKQLFVVFARWDDEKHPFSSLNLKTIYGPDLPEIPSFHPLGRYWVSASQRFSFCTLDMTYDEFRDALARTNKEWTRKYLTQDRELFSTKDNRFLVYREGVYDFVLKRFPYILNSNVKFE